MGLFSLSFVTEKNVHVVMLGINLISNFVALKLATLLMLFESVILCSALNCNVGVVHSNGEGKDNNQCTKPESAAEILSKDPQSSKLEFDGFY